MKNKSKIAFTINGQPIPGSVYGMLLRRCGGKYNADRVLYKARNAKNIVTYVSKGLKEGWIHLSTSEMDYNKKAVDAWIEEVINKKAPVKKKKKIQEVVINKSVDKTPSGLGDILKGLGI